MTKVFIYSLNCPIANQVKYVGKTKNSLSVRLSGHLSYSGSNIEKANWIKSLLKEGRKPSIHLLEIAPEHKWEEREKYWIEYFIGRGIALVNRSETSPLFLAQKKYLEQLQNQRYRKNTITTYTNCFDKFLYAFKGFDYPHIKKGAIVDYITQLVIKEGISPEYQNTIINAIKFYYERVLGYQRETYYIARPRKRKKIRPILTPQEVRQFMGAIKNMKQQTMFQVMYSLALRSGEVIVLEIANINWEDGVFLIKDSKGGQDRKLTIPEQTLNLIKVYLEKYKPKKWLFVGQDKVSHYHQRSLQQKFLEVVARLGFDPELKPHCLRHSRLSHLLNNGMKIEMASKYSGHASISTTADIYYHYMTEEMREQMDSADKKILAKAESEFPSTDKVLQAHPKKEQKQLSIPIQESDSNSEKTYQILFNGKTYFLKERDRKIIEAPQAKWSMGKEAEGILAWFKRKGAEINTIQKNNNG